jgi:putative addiction module component (TIGR02574 family)
MPKTKNDVTSEALKLPAKSRAQLAKKLIYSLEDSGSTKNEKLWAQEAASRYEEIASGKVKTKPAAKVLRDIRSKLK